MQICCHVPDVLGILELVLAQHIHRCARAPIGDAPRTTIGDPRRFAQQSLGIRQDGRPSLDPRFSSRLHRWRPLHLVALRVHAEPLLPLLRVLTNSAATDVLTARRHVLTARRLLNHVLTACRLLNLATGRVQAGRATEHWATGRCPDHSDWHRRAHWARRGWRVRAVRRSSDSCGRAGGVGDGRGRAEGVGDGRGMAGGVGGSGHRRRR